MAPTYVGKQAVVVGAGIGGLAAAGALVDHFEQVVVLERDSLPSDAVHRAGTPQSRHIHALLAGGQRALDELFPGFELDLARHGAVPLRVALDVRIEIPGYDPFQQRDLGWPVYSMSRPLIELVARQRVQQHPNITLRQRCRVRDLVASADRSAVIAVRCENADGRSEALPADLVVDARKRRLSASISAMPRQSSRSPTTAPSDWKGVLTLPQAPESSRGGLMLPLEGGEYWIVGVGGRYSEKPPRGFRRVPGLHAAAPHPNPA